MPEDTSVEPVDPEAAVLAALHAYTASVYGPGVVTGYVIALEYMDHDGDLIGVMLKDERSPAWRVIGLLSISPVIALLMLPPFLLGFGLFLGTLGMASNRYRASVRADERTHCRTQRDGERRRETLLDRRPST